MKGKRILRKCGEILIDMKSKNKNKIFIFQCTFCDVQCNQFNKFSLHIREEHLSDKTNKKTQDPEGKETSHESDIPKEVVLKFEVDPEDSPDKQDFVTAVENKVNVKIEDLDATNYASTTTSNEHLNYEVKYEIIETGDPGDMEEMSASVSMSALSETEEDYIEEPHDLRKAGNNGKKGKRKTQKEENSNDGDSNESNDTKPKQMDAKDRTKRYREKIKQNEMQWEEFKEKNRQRMKSYRQRMKNYIPKNKTKKETSREQKKRNTERMRRYRAKKKYLTEHPEASSLPYAIKRSYCKAVSGMCQNLPERLDRHFLP